MDHEALPLAGGQLERGSALEGGVYLISTNQTNNSSNNNNNNNSGQTNAPLEGELASHWLSKGKDETESSWLFWAVLGAAICVSIAILVIVWDIFCRCRDTAVQNVFDGGPPSSPGNQFFYTVGIKADEAAANLDTKLTVLKFELLDNWNRYLSTISVPAYLLKFRQDPESSVSASPTGAQSESKNGLGGSTKPAGLLQKSKEVLLELRPRRSANELGKYKSMSDLRETWSNSASNNSLLTFQLVRRTPLTNLASVRVTHDCYERGATMRLKYLALYDNIKKEYLRADFTNRVLVALHPCPSTRQQVFKIERAASAEQLHELKAFTSAVKSGTGFGGQRDCGLRALRCC